jgi:hypothetical protein
MTSDLHYSERAEHGSSSITSSPAMLVRQLPRPANQLAEMALDHIRSGTFQRSMSLLVVGTSIVSGAEVAYEHYRGGYSNPVMYSPVILSGVLSVAGVAAFFSRRMARTFLRWTSAITFLDGVLGFGFHIRGVARKPGGWRLPLTNIVMGPPIFAPLLFGTSAYLGVIASYLQREGDMQSPATQPSDLQGTADWREDIRVGRFQKHLCLVTAVWTFCSGFEAWYSHYKNNFQYRVQWSPIVLTPLLMGASLGALKSRRVANLALPVASAGAIVNGTVGFGYHLRGILRRPGGLKKPLYNTLYGPPIFAPMLFAACGVLGMLAYLMRRERS